MIRRCPRVLFVLGLAWLNACDCAADPAPRPDGGGSTDAGDIDATMPDRDGSACPTGERSCGASCCGAGEVCGTNVRCCGTDALCGPTCCDTATEVCEGAVCHLGCGTATRCTSDSGVETCCTAGEVCASGRCFLPTTPCRDFIDCPEGQYCEPSLGMCLLQPGGEACEAVPTGGEVTPTLIWGWDGTGAALAHYNQVMMTPMVANLTDDDSDGDVDADDIPDVVFISFCGVSGMGCSLGNYTSDGVLRAVSGADGSTIFDVTDAGQRVIPGGQVAIGDIDGDGLPEIVACGSDTDGIGPLIAFEHDGTFKWRTTDSRVSCAQAAPAIADLDADGFVEVFVRYTVVAGLDGALLWHHDCIGTGGWATSAHNPCDYTTAADLDGDGLLEVVGGNAAYHQDGAVHYDRSADFLEGYPAVGDLDRDGMPEVVVVHSAFTPAPYRGDHWLRALNGDGSDRWGPIDINQGMAPAADVTADTVGGGGPPTIANFDDDPEPEIALAGAYAYAVFEPDGTPRWQSPSDDASSRKTGSSVFDFDGDGVAEAVYSDHFWLRVYDGRDGNVRFCQCNTSATLWEYPVIVDVNNDLHAEIVVASNDYATTISSCAATPRLGPCELGRIAAGETAGSHGVRVFASPARDWVATRRIWNQHTYHVTNVSEAGAIPAGEIPNWRARSLNNFRQNVQPGATNLPDGVPEELAVDLTACPDRMTLNFRVVNRGWSALPAGTPVTVYVEEGGAFVRLGRVTTARLLLAGESEILSIAYDLVGRDPTADVRFRVVVNDTTDGPLEDLTECRPANNEAETTASCLLLI